MRSRKLRSARARRYKFLEKALPLLDIFPDYHLEIFFANENSERQLVKVCIGPGRWVGNFKNALSFIRGAQESLLKRRSHLL